MRLVTAVAVVLVAVAACTSSSGASAQASLPATPFAISIPPTAPPATAVPPSPSPAPTASPSPAQDISPTDGELYLASGIRSDVATDCLVVRERLPDGATAAVECVANDVSVDRFRVTLFSSTDAVLAVYLADMAANGVALNSGGCSDGRGEGTYFPGPDEFSFPYRHGCFIAGIAQYRAVVESETVSGQAHVLIAIAGRSPDVSSALEAYAWKGNLDTPGAPTLWRSPA